VEYLRPAWRVVLRTVPDQYRVEPYTLGALPALERLPVLSDDRSSLTRLQCTDQQFIEIVNEPEKLIDLSHEFCFASLCRMAGRPPCGMIDWNKPIYHVRSARPSQCHVSNQLKSNCMLTWCMFITVSSSDLLGVSWPSIGRACVICRDGRIIPLHLPMASHLQVSPYTGWINDPNGPISYKGKTHMCAPCFPHSIPF
jgi:hypothetical protein